MDAVGIAVYAVLAALNLFFVTRWVSKLWTPRCDCDSGCCRLISTRDATWRPLLLVLATDFLLLIAPYIVPTMEGPAMLLMLFPIMGWFFYFLFLFEPESMERDRKNARTPRIGWLCSFRRREFFTDYVPKKYAPYGWLARAFALTHFYNGFRLVPVDETLTNQQRITATLVIKATAAISPREFCPEAHKTGQMFLEALAARAGERNQLRTLHGFTPTHPGLDIEVQKLTLFPAPQPIAPAMAVAN